ncbi:MAG: hypothetical protein LBG98_03685 [Puniceicoccales bacterium]|jgi:hypothetical protein|nr:hypothetical protein [Puniceicoccales bacterium]
MADLQVKTFVNNEGYAVTGNTVRGEDLLREDANDGIMRPKAHSGDIGFVGNSPSLIIDEKDTYNPSVNASVAAQNKPSGAR